jgi:DMSO reductase family type II enzyme iron-sulfur subunit
MAIIQKQVRMVFDLNKCLGCHTCTMACKTMWTDGRTDLGYPAALDPIPGGGGLLYQYWNNVETTPGRGYPRGVFTPVLGGGFIQTGPNAGKLDFSGKYPSIEADYGSPWEYNYSEVLKTGGGCGLTSPPPLLTPTPSPDGPNAYSSNWDEDVATGGHPNSYYFYLPRICNHCTNPACVAACPKHAPYKRQEDGIVLIDQERCDGYRFCVKGCPYKKTYFNPELKKTQKCIFCYPRLEQEPGSYNPPQPPRENFCFNQCVGLIRFVGYYNLQAGPSDNTNLQKNVNKLIDKWKVALRLHPEYGTEPNLFYIPPFSPPTLGAGNVLNANTQRIPIAYLATLFGDNAAQTQAERVARIQGIFSTLSTERAKVAAGGTSELIDILNAHTEADRLQLYLG